MAKISAKPSTAKHPWWVPRYSLRTILGAITLFGVTLGIWAERSERQYRAAHELDDIECRWAFAPEAAWHRFLPASFRAFREGHYLRTIDEILEQSPNPFCSFGLEEEFDADEINELRSAQESTGERFLAASLQLPGLRQLEIERPIGSAELKQLARFRGLRLLKFTVGELTEADVPALRKIGSIPEIECTVISVDPKAASHIAHCSGIQRLSLATCDDEGLAALARLNKLTELSILRGEFQGQHLASLAKLPLRRMWLHSPYLGDENGVALENFQQVAELDLYQTAIGDTTAAALARMPSLRHLSIDETLVGDQGANALAKSRTLLGVSIENTAIGPEGVTALAESPLIKSLSCQRIMLSPLELIRIGKMRPGDFNFAGTDRNEQGPSFVSLPPTGLAEWKDVAGNPDIVNFVWFSFGDLRALTRDYPIMLPAALKRCGQLSDARIAHLATWEAEITRLNLSTTVLTDAGWQSVAKIESLEEIDCSGLPVTVEQLRPLSDLPKLVDLNLLGCQGIDRSLIDWIDTLPKLESLDIRGTSLTRADALELVETRPWRLLKTDFGQVVDEKPDMWFWFHLGVRGPATQPRWFGTPTTSYELFDLSNHGPLTNEQVDFIVDARYIVCFCAEMNDDQFARLKERDDFLEIGLIGPKIGRRSLEQIASRKNLEKLVLKRTEFPADDWAALENAHIEELALVDVVVDDNVGRTMGELPRLKRLSLAGTSATDDSLRVVTEAAKSLRWLVVESKNCSPAAIRELVMRMEQLRSLTLDGTRLSQAGLERLRDTETEEEFQEELANLVLESQESTDSQAERKQTLRPLTDVAQLAKEKRAESVSLVGVSITAGCLADISCMRQLRRLDLSETNFDDAAMASLSELRLLEGISLRNTKVTDAGLKSLTPLRRARMIDIRGTSVTNQGAEELRMALPSCWVLRTEEEAAMYEAEGKMPAEYQSIWGRP